MLNVMNIMLIQMSSLHTVVPHNIWSFLAILERICLTFCFKYDKWSLYSRHLLCYSLQFILWVYTVWMWGVNHTCALFVCGSCHLGVTPAMAMECTLVEAAYWEKCWRLQMTKTCLLCPLWKVHASRHCKRTSHLQNYLLLQLHCHFF